MLSGFPVRILILVLVAMVLTSCEDPAPVKIGFVGGFEGRNADLARAGRDGALLAVEEFNNAGGFDGRKIELLVRDDRNVATSAVDADRDLVRQGVVAILGHMTSEMSMAGVPVANENRIVMLSPSTSTNDLTGIDDYFLRVYPPNAGDAEALAMLARDELGVQRVSAAYDISNRAHTETWLRAFSAAFENGGGTVASAREFASSQATSLLALAREMLVPSPDAVLILAGSQDTGLLCQYLRGQGFAGPVLATQWSVTPDIFAHAGRFSNGIYFIDTFDRDSTNPAFLEFNKRFERRFGYRPGFSSSFSYEAATVLITAMKRNRDWTRVKETILEVREFQGLQSSIVFDRFGDITRPRFFKKIQDGQFIRAE